MIENTTSTEGANTLGEKMRIAREALNLSMEDVAKKINLRPSILQKLENNQFNDENTPPAFMRGYIRSYLKLLKLPENLIADSGIQFAETPKNDLSKNIRAKNDVNRYSSHGRWVSRITWLIVLIAIAMTVLWWWENHQQSNAERDNLVENYVAAQTETVAPGTSLTTAAQETTSNIQTQREEAPQAESRPMTETVTVEQAAIATQPLQAAETAITENAPAVTTETAPTAETAQATETVQTTDAVQTSELRIEVTGASCWISVKNAARKELAGKLYKQGEVLNFSEGSPYALIIGAPGNVKINYQGNEVPLKVDGRVAKFKLPQ